MKLEILKKHLESAVQTVTRVSNKNLSLPILQCVVISAKENHTTLRATNLDTSVEMHIKSKIIEGGTVAVPAHIFNQTINTLTDEKVILEGDTSGLRVVGVHGEIRLNTVDPSDFPKLPFVQEGIGTTITVPSKEFLRALRGVVFAAATTPIRPELSSVFVHVLDTTLITAATDSFRLAEMRVPVKTKHTADPILIPARNIQDIVRVVDGSEVVEVRFSDNQVTYIANGNYITSRTIDGAFPEYGAIIPKTFSTTATVLVEDMVNALRKVAVVADQTGQVHFSIDVSKKDFSIKGTNTSVGEIHESIEAVLEGEDVSMFFNVRYLLDALGAASADSVVLKFSGAGKPLILNEVPEKGFTYLVMPMNK